MTRVAELGTVVSVWAHPDDETYLAGGVMAEAAANGQRVVCLSATAGEHGTDDPVEWPPDRLGAIRRREAAEAMRVLGVSEHRWLDYEDGTLAGLDPEPAVRRLVSLIDEVRPDTILTFGPDGITFHPDHQTVGRWVFEAWSQAGRRGALLQAAVSVDHLAAFGGFYEEAGIYMTDERPVGLPPEQMAVHLVLGEELLERKVAALAAMTSQTAPLISAVGPDVFRSLVGTESFVAVPPE